MTVIYFDRCIFLKTFSDGMFISIHKNIYFSKRHDTSVFIRSRNQLVSVVILGPGPWARPPTISIRRRHAYLQNSGAVLFILASMFVFGWYVCLLLAKIYNVGKYVRLTVCLCLTVCLSVHCFFDIGHIFLYIITKHDPNMHLCNVSISIVFIGQKLNN